MRMYTIYNKDGKAVFTTFDEDRAFEKWDKEAGQTIDTQTIYMDDVNEFQYPTTTQEEV